MKYGAICTIVCFLRGVATRRNATTICVTTDEKFRAEDSFRWFKSSWINLLSVLSARTLYDAIAIMAFEMRVSCSRDDVCHEQTNADRLIKCFSDFFLFIFILTFHSLDVCAICNLPIIPTTRTNCIMMLRPTLSHASFELSIATAVLGSVEARARDYSSD